jgi:hypothetical protein
MSNLSIEPNAMIAKMQARTGRLAGDLIAEIAQLEALAQQLMEQNAELRQQLNSAPRPDSWGDGNDEPPAPPAPPQ